MSSKFMVRGYAIENRTFKLQNNERNAVVAFVSVNIELIVEQMSNRHSS